MTENPSPSGRTGDEGAFWSIVGYLLSGLLVWGGGGYLLDMWLGARYLTVIGLLIGVISAIYLIWLRYIKR